MNKVNAAGHRQEACSKVILRRLLLNPHMHKYFMNNKILSKALDKSNGKKSFEILYKLCNSLDGKPFVLKCNLSMRSANNQVSFAVYAAMTKATFLPNKLKYFMRKIHHICMNRNPTGNDGLFNFMKAKLRQQLSLSTPQPETEPRDSSKILAYTPRAVALAMAVEYAGAMNFLIDSTILDICRCINDTSYHKLFLLYHILQNYTAASTVKVKSLDVTRLFCPCCVKCVASPSEVESFVNSYKMSFCATCKCNLRHSNRKIKKPHSKCDSISFARRCSNDGSSIVVDDKPLADMIYDAGEDMLSYCVRLQFHQPISLRMIKRSSNFFTYTDDRIRFSGKMEFSSTFMMPCLSNKQRKCYNVITTKYLDSRQIECDDCGGSSWSRRKRSAKDSMTCVDWLVKADTVKLRPCVGCLIFLSCHHNRETFLRVREKLAIGSVSVK